jgi:FtsP/CotA-like multicopper oxidase with cupredoxin domain
MMNLGARRHLARLALMMGMAGVASSPADASTPNPRVSNVVVNDNQHPAGTQEQGTLTLALRAGIGQWQPEGSEGPSLQVQAFGEVGSALTVPSPLIRVREGTQIAVSVRNDLDTNLTMHGLCARDGSPCPNVEVAPGETCEVKFASGKAGTYHYWASAMGAPVPFRELVGAFVVDPADGFVEPDRILIITEWTSLAPDQLRQILGSDDPSKAFLAAQPRYTFTINGLSWPATERLTYHVGDKVRWRIINLSSQSHPIHLHGFYFDVDSLGNGLKDQMFEPSRRRHVVTQLLPSGGTMAMTWIPERQGNWLLHCHIMAHVSLDRRLEGAVGGHGDHPSEAVAHDHGSSAARSSGMAGMVLGITVLDAASKSAATDAHPIPPRKFTLAMQPGTARDGQSSSAGFVLTEGSAPAPSGQASAPGPTIVLRRNEPVEITLVNRLSEATAIHWHGIELESYYDGVHGFSGAGQQLAPMIEPGGTFVVRFTPPRTGTFIYHTHVHDYRQLSSGLYGSLIVTDPGETFDDAVDHVIVLGRSDITSEAAAVLSVAESVVMNGERAPRFVWKAGARHRVRLINITPDDIFAVALQTAEGLVSWKPLAKDGALVPEGESVAVPARQTIAVGETYDFEYEAPPGRKTAWLEVRTTAGQWLVQGQVIVK